MQYDPYQRDQVLLLLVDLGVSVVDLVVSVVVDLVESVRVHKDLLTVGVTKTRSGSSILDDCRIAPFVAFVVVAIILLPNTDAEDNEDEEDRRGMIRCALQWVMNE